MGGFYKKINLKIVLPILLAAAILIGSVGVLIGTNTFGEKPTNNNSVISNESNVTSELPVYNKLSPNICHTATITPGVDFSEKSSDFETTTSELGTLIDSIAKDKFDSVNVILNTKDGLIVSDTDERFSYINSYAKSNNLTVIATIDISGLLQKQYETTDDLEPIVSILTSDRLIKNVDMLVLDGYFLTENTEKNTEIMKALYYSVAKKAPELYLGIKCDYPYTKGCEGTEEPYMLDNKFADIKDWAENDIIDFCVISNPYPISDGKVKFEAVIDDWITVIGEKTDIYCNLSYTKLGIKESGWQKTDQIIKQIMLLSEKNVKGFMLDSYKSFSEGDKESRDTILKFIAGQINGKYILTDLSITSPTKNTMTTYNSTIAFIGASDPSFSLTLNGNPVERNELGYFSFDIDLNIGLNTFKVLHKGVTTTYKITYKKVVIKDYSPTTKLSLDGGSTVVTTAVALTASTVTATFNGETISLKEEPLVYENGTIDPEYSYYFGSFTLPIVYDNNKSLGKISIKAISKYGTETETSENITVKKSERPVVTPPPGPSLPTGGNYVDVGNSQIAEVIVFQAETFNAVDKADFSRPTNNYLPKGTVDYCSTSQVAYGSHILKTLRYGKNLYLKHNKNEPNIKVYEGTLPDHNEIGIANFQGDGRHSVLTLDVLWKAPFTLELKEQKYVNEGYGSERDYHLVNNTPTFSYIDITFCYSTKLTGELNIPENNKLFSKAEWIKNELDYTLRLYLKKTGAFYGWTAEYNDKGQLEFYFLNPATIKEAENQYGYSLEGITVLLNVGHGGNDSGAGGSNPSYTEEVLNLILAQKVKKELESIGATVIMDRTDNTTPIGNYERCALIHEKKPDYVLAIHRNSSSSTSPRGFQAFFFNAYSYIPTKQLYDKTIEANLYQSSKWNKIDTHLYFVSRVSTCPVVLTENGFMSNKDEYSDLIKDDFNSKCAVALTKGIVEHFKSIQ